MKKLCLLFFILIYCSINLHSQDIGYKCGFSLDSALANRMMSESIMNQSIISTSESNVPLKVSIILCVEKGMDNKVNVSRFIDEFRDGFDEYFNHISEVSGVTGRKIILGDIIDSSRDGGTARVFTLNDKLPYSPTDWANYVMTRDMLADLLQKVDNSYDFNRADNNADGIVDHLGVFVIKHSAKNNGGTVGLPLWGSVYTTNDACNGNQNMKIYGYSDYAIIQKLRCLEDNSDRLLSLAIHEWGHSFFNFPDIDHNFYGDYGHYAFGGFCAMADGQFRDVVSPYNPLFRLKLGYAKEKPVGSSGTLTFKSFEEDPEKILYSYSVPIRSGYSNAGQKMYMVYYEKSTNNRFTANWPMPQIGVNKFGGILMYQTNDTYDWQSREKQPARIMAAHGKWKWSVLDKSQMNPLGDERAIRTNQEDPVSGYDSLQVRYSYLWYKTDSIGYDGRPRRTPLPLYENGKYYRIGSESCFFTPQLQKDFAFYSNPNSNAMDEANGFIQSIASDLKVSNFRLESDSMKADIKIGKDAYIVGRNTTLFKGVYNLFNSITVPEGVTLTLQKGAILNLKGYSTINVYGTLIAEDTITINNDNTIANKAIYVYAGGNIALKNAEIKDAYPAILLRQNVNANLENLTITNQKLRKYGIYASGAFLSIKGLKTTNCSRAITVMDSTVIMSDLEVAASDTIEIVGSVRFANSSSLIVNGKLIIPGTTSKKYTIDFMSPDESKQNGIRINHGGSFAVSYAVIKNACNGILSYVFDPISNIELSGCTYGIKLLNMSGSSNPNLPSITRCNIHDNTLGVFCGYFSNPSFGLSNTGGYNHIHNNYMGVRASGGSVPFLGEGYSSVNGGYNILENNSYDIYADLSGVLYAELNYWGSDGNTPANYIQNGAIPISPKLTARPIMPWETGTGSMTFASAVASGDALRVAASDNELSNLSLAVNESLLEKEYKKSRKLCLSYIEQFADSSSAVNALMLLSGTYGNEEKEELKIELSKLYRRNDKKEVYAMAGIMLANLDMNNRIQILDEVIDNYGTLKILPVAYFGKLLHYVTKESNMQEAVKVMLEIENKFPDSFMAKQARELMAGNLQLPGNLAQKMKLSLNQDKPSDIPQTYELSANYPNPFNPTTNINYQLPEAGFVTLKVFDVLGREVATLVNDFKVQGRYMAEFNADGLSSGTYIYELRVNEFRSVKKMMLVK